MSTISAWRWGIGTLALIGLLAPGCSSVNVRSQPYLGVPRYPPSDPARVEILAREPARPKDRLAEIILDIEGSPSRDEIEGKIRGAVAELGGDAAFIVFDQTHLFPVVYTDAYGTTVSQEARRGIVAVAIKYK